MDEVEQSVSGFKVTGTWSDIVELGERITLALEREDIDGEAFEEWQEWRPKVEEHLDKDVSEKTAEQASVDEGAGEQAGKDATDDIQTAGEKLEETYESLGDGGDDDDASGPIEKAQDTLAHAKRAADTASRKALRTVEDKVYRDVMTKFAPYYFDNELISANLASKSGLTRDEQTYVFEVNINDDDLKAAVADHLDDFDDIDRWHVDTPKDTSSLEEVENVEAPDDSQTNTPDTT